MKYEFQQLYPSAFRAFQLIPLMYNRLTLIDKKSHTEAWRQIHQDHQHLPGFSRRNIYRLLPSDNPKAQRRVVPSRHKPTCTKLEDTILESNTETDTSRS